MTDHVNDRAGAIERAFGLLLDIRGVSRSELAALAGGAERLAQAVLPDGVLPLALSRRSTTNGSMNMRLETQVAHRPRKR